MLLSCQNISKEYVTGIVLNQVSFHIEDHDKAAIVGINGAGKTTLLRIITKQLEADNGIVTFSKEKTMGYLAQDSQLESNVTIYDELLSVKQNLLNLEAKLRETENQMDLLTGEDLNNLIERYHQMQQQFEVLGGYTYQSELLGVLHGLGFEDSDFQKKISTLSGGQKTRVALGKMLLMQPDLIILDEPTNHLDMNSIAWLETYLLNYKGAVLIVSHDRYFLDKITNKIIELDRGKCTEFEGNYSDYSVKKQQLRTAALHAYLNQQKEIKHQEEVIQKLKSFNREKSIKRAESREKMLNKIDVLDKPTEEKADMKLQLVPHCQSGMDVLRVEELAKSYDKRCLFRNVSFEIKRGEHVAIIGDNGTGKTTLLKILNELITADSGSFTLGSKVEIGYYDQEHQVLHSDKTLYDEIADAYPDLTITEIRSTLAAFLFTGDDVYKKIKDLSGGERGRVSLAKLMLSNCNFLILDEPTNHLDIVSKEILENALNHYEGTVLYVSHDRYFINKTATRILELYEQQFINYIGNYDYYLEKREKLHTVQLSTTSSKKEVSNPANPINPANQMCPNNQANQSYQSNQTSQTNQGNQSNQTSQTNQGNQNTQADSSSTASSDIGAEKKSGAGVDDWKMQKQLQAKQRKKENELKKCEEAIAKLEDQIAEVEKHLADPSIASNSVKLQEFTNQHTALTEELEKLYEQWETLAE